MKCTRLLVLSAIIFSVNRPPAIESSSPFNTPGGIPDGWVKVEAGAFSIQAPLGWEFHELQGEYSYVGKFTGNGVALHFDFGRYSNPLDDYQEPTYVVAHELVGGYKAKIVSPRVPGHGLTAIYFPRVPHSKKLCVWGKDLTSTQQELVLRIFETIRFGPNIPPYDVSPLEPRAKEIQ